MRAVVSDYVEGWFDGDATRIERALHPELAKRCRGIEGDDPDALETLSAREMIDATAAGEGCREDAPSVGCANQQQTAACLRALTPRRWRPPSGPGTRTAARARSDRRSTAPPDDVGPSGATKREREQGRHHGGSQPGREPGRRGDDGGPVDVAGRYSVRSICLAGPREVSAESLRHSGDRVADGRGGFRRRVPGTGNGFRPRLEDADARFEIDDNDLSPYPLNPPPAGAEHVGAWNYIYSGTVYGRTTPLDANQHVIQDELLSTIASFAADGNPAGQGTPAWPRFNRSDEVLSMQPAGDSELISDSQLAAQYNCAFWDKLSPNP